MKINIKALFDTNASCFKLSQGYHCGVVSGEIGLMVCHAFFYQVYKEDKNLTACFEIADSLLVENTTNQSLGYGLAGLAWGLDQLRKIDLLEEGSDLWFSKTNYRLKESYYNILQTHDFDYFTGATGILNYFLSLSEKDGPEVTLMVNSFIQFINKLSVEYFFTYRDKSGPEGQTLQLLNLGVPHGVTGIILLLIRISEKTGMDLSGLIAQFIDRLFTFRDQDDGLYSFASFTGEQTRGSTLAWCYGDLPILYILTKLVSSDQYASYRYLQDELRERTLRRTDSMPDDLSLCHGMPVITYFYFKLWKLTSQPEYKQAFEYWKGRMWLTFKKKAREKEASEAMLNPSLFNGGPAFYLIMLTVNENLDAKWDDILLL